VIDQKCSSTWNHSSRLMVVSVCIAIWFSIPAKGSSVAAPADSDFYHNLPMGLTHDHDISLAAVLPDSVQSSASCVRYWAALDPVSEKVDLSGKSAPQIADLQRDLVLCGKWLFFELPVPTQVGIPNVLLQAFMQTFPDQTGRAFEQIGFREDPRKPGWPLELPRVPAGSRTPRDLLIGPVRTMACTACHLGRLPDGRFSVGMPNDALDLGKFNQLVSYPLWLAGHGPKDVFRWDPKLDAAYREMYAKSRGRVNLPRVLLDLSALADFLNIPGTLYSLAGQDPLPETDQRTFYKSGRGRLNPSAPMLSEPRHEIYVSSAPIWNMRHYETPPPGSDDGIGEPYLGRVVSSRSLEEFIRQAFVFTTLETRTATPRYVDPIAAYLRTLQVPQLERPVDQAAFLQGKALFQAQCAHCHNGYAGATKENHPLEATQSPLVFDAIFHDYEPPTRQSKIALAGLKEVGMLPLARTGIKSRRLNGLWARQRLTENGAIEGMDHLLCLQGWTRDVLGRENPLSQATHMDLCEDYTIRERQALKEFLEQASF
jgi:hypothetical protein